jgi:hypothetical protein
MPIEREARAASACARVAKAHAATQASHGADRSETLSLGEPAWRCRARFDKLPLDVIDCLPHAVGTPPSYAAAAS